MDLPVNQLNALLEAAPDAIVVVDEAGAIRFANARAETLFGYARAELVGEPLEMLLPQRLRAQHRVYRAAYSASPQPRPMGTRLELFALRNDGTELPVEISLSPVAIDGVRLVSSAIRDVTERRNAERALRDAREEADRANRAKSAFLAAASHDLRQPLQTLALLGGVLRREVPSTSKAAQAVAAQNLALASMSDLLSSLLDISKLEAGVVKPDIGDCAVQSIFDRLRGEFAELAAAKGLQLIVDPSPDTARSDATLLQQIVQNLLANAIRYTRQGWVRLQCLRLPDALRIEVLDTGIGIPAEELGSIFNEFYRGPRSAELAGEGAGLGLSIVRRLASLLDHTLEVESTVGVGSRFAVNVPRGAARRSEAAGAPAAAGQRSGERVVLVLDDEPAVAEATALLLDVSGYRPVVAANLEQAEERLRKLGRAPDLLLCDYRLRRGGNGIDAIHRLRATANACVPAILASGDTSSGIRAAVATIDRCEHLAKPVSGDELLAVMARLLEEPT